MGRRRGAIGRGEATLVTLALASTLALAPACAEPEPIELVAVRGCGLDQEFSNLRVRVLADRPPTAGSELLLGPGERGEIAELPESATGLVAEGLFGGTVTAVGRSYGVDPELAAGRLPGVGDSPALAVFFASPDGLCEVPGEVPARSELAGAEGLEGDVLLAGGRDGQGSARPELVHVDLLAHEARILDDSLPDGRVGHSVHALGGRRFAIVAGAEGGEARASWTPVDLDASPSVGEPEPLRVDGEDWTRAWHASGDHPEGRVLIAGGCTSVDAAGDCDPSTATAATAWFDLELGLGAGEGAPDLAQARYAAQAVVSADGLAYVAGGFDPSGAGLASLERLRPGGDWQLVHALDDGDGPIVGLAVLDGGLVVLAGADGQLHWWSEAGSGGLDPTLRAPPLSPVVTGARPLSTLPGERTLVDTWLFAPGSAAIDPSGERVELAGGAQLRSGARSLVLRDGSVLIAGGRSLVDGAPVEPAILRLRPELDGPDEWIPDLAGPQTDAFVANRPGAVTVVVGGLELDGVDQAIDELPRARAHVRGFRSRRLRVEFAFERDPEVGLWLTLGQGSAGLIAIELGPELRVLRRRPSGAIDSLDCGPTANPPTDAGLVFELGEGGRRLHLFEAGGDELLDCTLSEAELPWPRADAGLSLGFGVSGPGTGRVFGLRLARR